MKFVLFFTLFLFSAVGHSQNECIPTDFCKDKIQTLVAALKQECFKIPTRTTINEFQDAENSLEFESCIREVSAVWRNGFKKICGGANAQTACLEECKKSTNLLYCLDACPRF